MTPENATSGKHSLTVHFARVLSEAEFREAVDVARTVPHGEHLEANWTPTEAESSLLLARQEIETLKISVSNQERFFRMAAERADAAESQLQILRAQHQQLIEQWKDLAARFAQSETIGGKTASGWLSQCVRELEALHPPREEKQA